MDEPDFHSVFEADFEVGTLFWKSPPKNHAEKVGMEAGCVNIGKGKNKNYWQVRAFGRTYKRSRVIFRMAHGRWPEPSVDHVNGNSLDDRLDNLRECSHSQNSVNSRDKLRKKHDLPRGVYETKQGKFMARLTVNGQSLSLGVYASSDEAKQVYQKARKETFGEFA